MSKSPPLLVYGLAKQTNTMPTLYVEKLSNSLHILYDVVCYPAPQQVAGRLLLLDATG